MLFLTRSALCIGLVALAASNAGGPTLETTLASGSRDAARTLGEACLQSSGCLRLGPELLNAATASFASPPRPIAAAPPRTAAARTHLTSVPLHPTPGAATRDVVRARS